MVRCRVAIMLSISFLLTAALSRVRAQEAEGAADDGTVSRGVGVAEAYKKLLNENLALRSRIDDLSDRSENVKERNRRLQGTVADLEKRIQTLVARIGALSDQAEEKVDPAEVKALRTRITGYEQEKRRLTKEIGELQERIGDLNAASAAADTPAPGTETGVAPGSALFRKLEHENARLRQAIQDLEAEKAGMARDDEVTRDAALRRDAAIEELESERRAKTAQRDIILKLGTHLHRLRDEVHELEDDVYAKEARLRRERARVKQLEEEIDQRDETIRKIKRIGDLLDRIDREKDLHSMPVVERRKHYRLLGDERFAAGEFRLAQAAYHKALSIDPSYADVHYNLALLYDEHLGDDNRALTHYNAYLELRPNADDASLVKLWIREAELRETQEVVEPVPEGGLSKLLEQAIEPPMAGDEQATSRDFYIDQAQAQAQGGRVKDAARAYRRALGFDPDYADIHYNLGVLYDDFLEDNARAAEHYRRYIELRPHASDADQVRLWLREAELGW